MNNDPQGSSSESNVVSLDTFNFDRRLYDRPDTPPLKASGSGGTSSGMEPSVPMKDYVDLQLQAAETRTNAKLDNLATREDVNASRNAVRNNVWGAAAAILGVLLAVLAFGGDRFDGGISASSLVREQSEAQSKVDAAQDAKLESMDDKLDVLIKRSETQ